MNKKWASRVGLASTAALVALTIVGVSVATDRGGAESELSKLQVADDPTTVRPPVTPSADPSELASEAAGQVSAPGVDLPCESDAVPVLVGLDVRYLDAIPDNPVAQQVGASVTRQEAAHLARGQSSNTDVAADAPAAALKAPYSWTGQTNPLVAASRCVWVVTVQAPFAPRSAPEGLDVGSWEWYTAVYDAASGQFLSIGAGPKAIYVAGDALQTSEALPVEE